MSSQFSLTDASLDDKFFLQLLEKLISETKNLQNKPPSHVPKEKYAAQHVLEALKPYDKKHNPKGALEVSTYEYAEDRPNIIVRYAGSSDRTVAFVGSHLDVVPANPDDWKRNPFKLEIGEDGDTLYGRGTTDCLGHVALVTNMFVQVFDEHSF